MKNFTFSTLTPTPNSTNSTEATDSANWKTYTNEKYRFTIKLPLNMVQGPSDPRVMVFSTLENAQRVTPKSDIYVGYSLGLPTVEFISCSTDQKAYDQLERSLSVGNAGGLIKITKIISSRSISGLEVVSSHDTTYWFNFCQNSHEFEIKFSFVSQASEQTPLVDQILSTFKFTSQ